MAAKESVEAKLEACFDKNGLHVPAGLAKFFEVVDVGATGRKAIYSALYQRLRKSGVMKEKTRLVWPVDIRQLVREVVPTEEGERPAGAYDSQHEDNPRNFYITMEQIADLEWEECVQQEDNRPSGGGKAPRRKR